MASKHREQQIIAAVACPRCGAARGDPCRVVSGRAEGLTAMTRTAQGLRPVVHGERRHTWQRLR